MKTFFILVLLTAAVGWADAQESFYNFKVKDIDGKIFDFAQLEGKKVMVVNTASKCGLTPQYRQLQALYEQFGHDKFTIIGFPANNFLHQEPGSESQIAEFCQKNYGVTFPMMSKISVKGKDIHPLYQWLTQKEKNGVMDSGVSWNFQKYLIDESGKLVDIIKPTVRPDDDRILKWLEN